MPKEEMIASDRCMRSGEYVADNCNVKICCASLESDGGTPDLSIVGDGEDVGDRFIYKNTVAQARSEMDAETKRLEEKLGMEQRLPEEILETCEKCFSDWAEVAGVTVA